MVVACLRMLLHIYAHTTQHTVNMYVLSLAQGTLHIHIRANFWYFDAFKRLFPYHSAVVYHSY